MRLENPIPEPEFDESSAEFFTRPKPLMDMRVVRSPFLNDAAKGLYVALRHGTADEYVEASLSELSDQTGYTTHVVRQSLLQLEKVFILRVVARKGLRNRFYFY